MVKVVLADDEEYVRDLLRVIMDKLGFSIEAEVENGAELFQVMVENRPDILLLDINMPGLTGIEFLKKYASKLPKTCIILLTSSSLMSLIGEPCLVYANCFLRKNTPIEELVESIRHAWESYKNPKIVIGDKNGN